MGPLHFRCLRFCLKNGLRLHRRTPTRSSGVIDAPDQVARLINCCDGLKITRPDSLLKAAHEKIMFGLGASILIAVLVQSDQGAYFKPLNGSDIYRQHWHGFESCFNRHGGFSVTVEIIAAEVIGVKFFIEILHFSARTRCEPHSQSRPELGRSVTNNAGIVVVT